MAYEQRVKLPAELEPYGEAACARLRAMRPGLDVHLESGTVVLLNAEDAASAATLMHLLYQEKIYAETLGVRRALYARVLAR